MIRLTSFTVLAALAAAPEPAHAADAAAPASVTAAASRPASPIGYLADYLAATTPEAPDAIATRQRMAQRYALEAQPGPGEAGAPGADKSALLFHLLEMQVGREALETTLEDFRAPGDASKATWTALRKSAERASGQDLRAFFGQWVERPGLPHLALENVRQDGGAVTGEIVQRPSPVATAAPRAASHSKSASAAPRPYELDIEVVATLADGRSAPARVHAAAGRVAFRIEDAPHAVEVVLDPQWHVPRRVEPAHLPASLARTLAGRPLLVVHPDPPRPEAGPGQHDLYDRIVALAKDVAGAEGRVMPASVAATAEVESANVLLLGSAAENAWVRRLAPALAAADVDVSQPGSFRAGARRWRGRSQALLVSVAHPNLAGATLSAWIPNGPETLESARGMLAHGWDGWIAMERDAVLASSTSWPLDVPWRARLDVPASERPASARLMETLAAITSPAHEGRECGTVGARAVADLVVAALRGMGVQPAGTAGLETPFEFGILDLAGIPALRWSDGEKGTATIPVLPATEWLPRPSPEEAARLVGSADAVRRLPVVLPLAKGLVFAGGPAPRFAGLDLKDAAAVVLDDGSPGARERIIEWMREARLRNAKALIVMRPASEWPGEPGLVLAAASPGPARAERLAALRESEGPRAVEREVAREAARTPGLGDGATFPLFFAGSRLDALLRERGATRPGARVLANQETDLRLSVRVEYLRDTNVVARIPGTTRDGSAVLLSAHHDGLGERPDGTFRQGAADGAASLAVLLEVARRLAARPAARDVVVVSCGGEEWGQQGARALASHWSEPAIAAVVNVGAVGQAGAPLHVVGRTREPRLAAAVDEAARAAGLALGGDIDARADRDGGGHWPWAAQGVPAVSVVQADLDAIAAGKDAIEQIDPATLAKVADAVEASVRAIAGAAPSGG